MLFLCCCRSTKFSFLHNVPERDHDPMISRREREKERESEHTGVVRGKDNYNRGGECETSAGGVRVSVSQNRRFLLLPIFIILSLSFSLGRWDSF